jgi:hypothetical protein
MGCGMRIQHLERGKNHPAKRRRKSERVFYLAALLTYASFSANLGYFLSNTTLPPVEQELRTCKGAQTHTSKLLNQSSLRYSQKLQCVHLKRIINGFTFNFHSALTSVDTVNIPVPTLLQKRESRSPIPHL